MTGFLVGLAVVGLWLGSLYVRPFGRCWRCGGTGHLKRRRGRRAPKCPRCKGLRRIQRRGSRTVHRLARKVRTGQAVAAKHQQQEED